MSYFNILPIYTCRSFPLLYTIAVKVACCVLYTGQGGAERGLFGGFSLPSPFHLPSSAAAGSKVQRKPVGSTSFHLGTRGSQSTPPLRTLSYNAHQPDQSWLWILWQDFIKGPSPARLESHGSSVVDPWHPWHPYHWHKNMDPDPDPALFINELQDDSIKQLVFCLLLFKDTFTSVIIAKKS